MTKRTRFAAVALLSLGLLGAPAAGAAFAADSPTRSVSTSYSHDVQAMAGDVSYSSSTSYTFDSDSDESSGSSMDWLTEWFVAWGWGAGSL